MRVPLFTAASTTSTPFDMPDIILLRLGKFPLSGEVPGGNSDITAPHSQILLYSCLFSAGYTTSTPLPSTAMVAKLPFGAFSIAARAEMQSMPWARPDTTHTPLAASSAASIFATSAPYSEHCLEPIIPMGSGIFSGRVPFTYSTIGGRCISLSNAG